MDTFIKAVVLAILEGLTEFIPVSSTGHMILLGYVIDFTGPKAAAFEIFIQLGAILAVVFIYWEKFIGLIPKKTRQESWLRGLFFGESKPTMTHLILAVFPALLMGFLFYKTIRSHLFGPVTVAYGLIAGGIIMILVELWRRPMPVEQVEKISLKQALIIGIGQCFALWPGMSRSGSTMVTSLLIGIKHKPAADFSFIIAVPVMVAAVGYDLLKSWNYLHVEDIPYFSVGFVVAFIISWLSVKWFLAVLTRVKLIPFGIYRIIAGIFSLWLLLS